MGEGTEQDIAEAKKWYVKSAAQGNIDAQANLKTME
jgi:TPR repeat protein